MADATKLLQAMALAKQRLDKLALIEAFAASDLSSRPTASQQELLNDLAVWKYTNYFVMGGNQCLAKGTLVATPAGPKAIEDIVVGDTVYDPAGKEIKVLKTFANGVKVVNVLCYRKMPYVMATDEHTFLVEDGHGRMHERKVKDIKRDDRAVRVQLTPPLGDKAVPEAYAIGVMLGDGCCREGRKCVSISSINDNIPNKVSAIIGGNNVHRNSIHNYTWQIRKDGANIPIPFSEWFHDKYAHEKTVDINEIKNWDRKSILQLLAGVFDTDGCLVRTKDILAWTITMQALPVLKACKYILLAAWGIETSISVDNRDKYVHGPCYTLKVAHPHFVATMMRELDKEIISPQKKWKEEYLEGCGKRSSLNRLSLTADGTATEVETYDIHVDSPRNLYCLANGVVTHNSGKSQTIRKVIALLMEEHPDSAIKRKPQWKGPLQIILVGRNYKQLEDSIWKGISEFFGDDEVHLIRNGNTLYKAIHRKTGNSVLFFSHENPGQCADRVQSFTAHVVVLDEMPVGHKSVRLVEELQKRIMINDGVLIFPFTPKSVNKDLKNFVESIQPPAGRKYTLKSLDNPSLSDESRSSFLASLAALPENYRKCVLEGEWMTADNAVYYFNDDEMIMTPPPNYHASWRHVVGIDPGLDSATGLVVGAEDPTSGRWYLIRAEYIKNIFVVEELVQDIRSRISGLNCVRFVVDGASTWFIHTANKMGMTCVTPYDKNNRREEMMKNLQAAMGTRLFFAPWCNDLIEEFKTMHWSETVEGKVAKSSKFHTADAVRYFWDCIPKFENVVQYKTWDHELRESNKKRKAIEALEAKLKQKSPGRDARPIRTQRRSSRW